MKLILEDWNSLHLNLALTHVKEIAALGTNQSLRKQILEQRCFANSVIVWSFWMCVTVCVCLIKALSFFCRTIATSEYLQAALKLQRSVKHWKYSNNDSPIVWTN